jgi:LPS-assembly lipoprotein
MICFFLITACGFRPLYQNVDTLSGGTTALDRIYVDRIANGPGVMLRNHLIDRFYNSGMPEDAPYVLQVTLFEDRRNLAISRQDTTTRSQLILRAQYKLLDRATRQTVDSGEARAVNSYNILSSQYTTLVTENEARELALQELADEITRRMAVVMQE